MFWEYLDMMTINRVSASKVINFLLSLWNGSWDPRHVNKQCFDTCHPNDVSLIIQAPLRNINNYAHCPLGAAEQKHQTAFRRFHLNNTHTAAAAEKLRWVDMRLPNALLLVIVLLTYLLTASYLNKGLRGFGQVYYARLAARNIFSAHTAEFAWFESRPTQTN